MNEKNQTLVSEIVLLGFQNLHNFKIPLFSLFLLIYIITVWENVLIIVLVSSSRNLKSPMYFFLQQLSLCDLLNSTVIVPTLLKSVINGGVTVSFIGCVTQFSFFSVPGAFECLLLAVMSYDRYVAICIPLRYSSIMSHRVCVTFILISWATGFGIGVLSVNLITMLQFCDRNTINHFFCDFFPLLGLVCSDTSFVQLEEIIQSFPVVICPFILIIVSYMCIAHAILKIVSNTGRQKAFSTCSSHLTVVSIFYGSIIAIYVVPPTGQSQTISKVLSLMFTLVIPMTNPIIYSLKSTDIRETLKKMKSRRLEFGVDVILLKLNLIRDFSHDKP
ncbi:olfactory receptor 10C1 [Xenopus laevis]|uniref:Olfactory receptor n=1 Tax=Xenopus laevis TaxID=8355 RepID=A0A8J1MJI3_XENLA|nr:olfactory receptor 10C1 [Xenopus laevis]